MQAVGDGGVDDGDAGTDADSDSDADTDTAFDVPPGHLLWAVSAGGDEDDEAFGLAGLADGTLVVVGSLSGEALFGEGEGNQTQVVIDGPRDGFIARLDGADGELIWARGLGGAGYDEAEDVDALGDDRLAVVGSFEGEVLIGYNQDGPTWLESAGGTDAFVAVYHLDGDIAWAARAGGPGIDVAAAVAGSSVHGLYLAGRFVDDIVFDEGGAGETGLSTGESCYSEADEGPADLFVARYGVDGGFLWARAGCGAADPYSTGSWSFLSARDVALGADGSALLTGSSRGNVVLFPGEPDETEVVSPITTGAGDDIFVGSLDQAGGVTWARIDGSGAKDRANAVAVLEDGASIATGVYSGDTPNQSAYFGYGEPDETVIEPFGYGDIFLARYAADGTLDWVVRAGSDFIDQAQGLAAWSDGSSVVTGFYHTGAVFGEGGPNETVLKIPLGGRRTVFVARYSPDGALEWATRAAYDYDAVGTAAAITADGAVLVAGYFEGTAVFGEGEPHETVLESHGERDIFVAKYAP